MARLRPPRGLASPRPRRLLEWRLRRGGHHLGHELRPAGLPPAAPRLPPAAPRLPPAAPRLPPAAPRLPPAAPRLPPAASNPVHPPPATPRTLPATLCTPSLHPHASQAFSASTAALAYAMEPLFAALFAAAILHESIHELQLLGGTLVVSPAPDTDTDTDTALLGREHSWRSPTGLAPDPALAPAPASAPTPTPTPAPAPAPAPHPPPRPPPPSPPAPSPSPCPHQVLANVLVAVGSTHVLSCFSRHC
jgi:hypothetical protein